ncbi:hypothetical protein [Geopseudomonas aromaticivorans]
MRAGQPAPDAKRKPLAESLREPLTELLAHWLGPAWAERTQTELDRAGRTPLQGAVDRLIAGQKAVTLPKIDRHHLEHLKDAADRMSGRTVSGTRSAPDAGYSYRTVCTHGQLGVVLRLDVPATNGCDTNSWLTVESIFMAEEFARMSGAVRKSEAWTEHGPSQAYRDAFSPDAPEVEQEQEVEVKRRGRPDKTYDLVMETPTLTMTPRF